MLGPLLIAAGVILLTTVTLVYVRLGEIGRGMDVVRISRRSRSDPEHLWRALHEAWAKTALTFQPTTFRRQDDPATRLATSSCGTRKTDRILTVTPFTTGAPIRYHIRRLDGVPDPFGPNHFESWSVIADGKGSRIEVSTQGRSSPLATAWELWLLWRKAGLLAAGKVDVVVNDRPPIGFRQTPEGTPRAKSRRLGEAPGNALAVSLVAFALLLLQYSWQSAVVLAAVILFHEYGHLLSYQLTGRRGNRLMLVPFLGGMAVASAPHKSEAERAFCALAGPGICVVTTMGGMLAWQFAGDAEVAHWARRVVYFSAFLNGLNLLPIYPLDGGHTVESFFRTYVPGRVNLLLKLSSAAGLLMVLGMGYLQAFVFFGFFAVSSLKGGVSPQGLRPMSGSETSLIALAYLVIAATHAIGIYAYFQMQVWK